VQESIEIYFCYDLFVYCWISFFPYIRSTIAELHRFNAAVAYIGTQETTKKFMNKSDEV
jgi:hypothetical protein